MSSNFKPTKVTPEKFEAIKKAMSQTDMTTAQLGRRFNVGRSTLQTIRHCNTYGDYKAFLARQLAEKKARQTQDKEKHVSSDYDVAHFISGESRGFKTEPAQNCSDEPTNINLCFTINHRRTFWELLVIAFYDICVALVILVLICVVGAAAF